MPFLRRPYGIPGFFLLLLSGIGLTSCNNHSVDRNVEKGKALANQYCQSCHLLPDPAMMTKSIWTENILPNMGPRLGIFNYKGRNYPSFRNSPLIGRNFYPSKPLLNPDEWEAILQYYSAAAPDSLPGQSRSTPIELNNNVFQAVIPSKHYPDPVSTYIAIDTGTHQVFQADGQLGLIYKYDQDLKLTDSSLTRSMVVDMIRQKNKLILCNVGVINPNDGLSGRIEEIPSTGRAGQPKILHDSLRRPVQLIPADLNADGREDLIVCEFGNLLGALSWLENKGDAHYIRHVLRGSPGAIHAIVQDYNQDGLPDLWVLFAQGDESIILFTNKGRGQFEQETLLRFPAINGSTYFELHDFNGDGYPDILYAAGDNADFSQVLKPYHGVYIFLNDGHQHFRQSFFYPIHGCFKAMARDFDGDGDLDIAAISFFADYTGQPDEGFVYLENKGNWVFKASSLPQTRMGRWLTMDAGDLDGDGRPDLVLGNFSVGPTPAKLKLNWKKGPPFLLLKNISGKSQSRKSGSR